MSAPGTQGSPQAQGPPTTGPPYAPTTQALGGVPDIIPDVPATAVVLALYIIMATTHLKILKANKARGHKFFFSGALLGFCKVRIITMSLRIAWSCHRTNVSLAIAAQIFVYVGTIILYLVNWFFTQRIVRAQHPTRWGWTKPYRVLHRATIGILISCLIMLIVAAIQQFFTLDTRVRHIDRDLQLLGQTYFAAFCFAPILVVSVSLLLPRKGTEKFGAGRLRNAIIILMTAATILSIGQIFRCATTWLTPVPLRNAQGQPLPTQWYFSKACFYVFNFTTEMIVVIFYAVVRVDLRFHVPDGAKRKGDYAAGRSGKYVDVVGNKKSLECASKLTIGGHSNLSRDTLHEYEASVFDDTRTLADSLQYPSSVLEVDPKTGHWKIKRQSGTPSVNTRYSSASQPSLWSPDRDTYIGDEAPPVPALPADWPLRESQMPRSHIPRMEHSNQRSPSNGSNELPDHDYNGIDMSNAISEAIAKLEANSEASRESALNKEYGPDKDIGGTSVYTGEDEDAINPVAPAGTALALPVRAYQPNPNPNTNPNPHRTLYSRQTSPSSSTSQCPGSNSWMQKYSPSSVRASQEGHSPRSASSASYTTAHAEAEKEFRRFSYEAPRRDEDEDLDMVMSEEKKIEPDMNVEIGRPVSLRRSEASEVESRTSRRMQSQPEMSGPQQQGPRSSQFWALI